MNSSKDITPSENGWEAAELSTLREGARLTFRERLLWLQDMLEFADRFGGAASGRKLDRDGNIILVPSRLGDAVAENQTEYHAPPPPPAITP